MKQRQRISPIKYQLLTGALIFVFTLLSVRLVDLQLVHGKDYFALSEDNKSFQEIIARRRGVILDRYGEIVTFNEPIYFLRDSATLFGLQTRIPAEEALLHAATSSAETELLLGMQRSYPFGSALSHVVGYTGAVSAKNLESDAQLLASDSIGIFGLELFFERLLRGETGFVRHTINAKGQRLGVEHVQAGKSGQSLGTSLDPYLSTVASELLGDLQGSVIISDPKTGQILTLVSSPSFDPNILTKPALDRDVERERQEAVRQAITHPKKLFFNRAISGAYPPGSVFKLVTAIAGIETNAITATTTVEDTGVLSVNDFDFANWYYSQYGRTEGVLSLQRALARSNDIFFYKAAEAIGPNKLAEFARLFGYGEKTAIELGGEVAGIVPDPEWKEQKLGERWFLGNTYHFGIGQGLLLVTPLQVAQMTASIANKGTHCPLTLLATAKQCEGLGIEQSTLDLVMAGMLDACSTGGTAYPLFAYNEKHLQPGVGPYEAVQQGAIACKTGTAEFGGTDAQGYKSTHAWFTAVVGTKPIVAALSAQNPELAPLHAAWKKHVQTAGLPETLAFTVLIESDEAKPYREGSADAAPIVAKMLEWMETGKYGI